MKIIELLKRIAESLERIAEAQELQARKACPNWKEKQPTNQPTE